AQRPKPARMYSFTALAVYCARQLALDCRRHSVMKAAIVGAPPRLAWYVVMVRLGSGKAVAPALEVVSGGASDAFHCESVWPAPLTWNQEPPPARLLKWLFEPVTPARL